jgi:aspartate 1-decarboxylase
MHAYSTEVERKKIKKMEEQEWIRLLDKKNKNKMIEYHCGWRTGGAVQLHQFTSHLKKSRDHLILSNYAAISEWSILDFISLIGWVNFRL